MIFRTILDVSGSSNEDIQNRLNYISSRKASIRKQMTWARREGNEELYQSLKIGYDHYKELWRVTDDALRTRERIRYGKIDL